MTEEQILADGHWVKFYFLPKLAGGERLFSGVYVRPKDVEIRRVQLDGSEFEACIESQLVKGAMVYTGKVGSLRMPLKNQDQYNNFIGFALGETAEAV